MNNTVDIKKYAVNFNRARGNLLAVVGLTLLNVILIIADVDLAFLFSAFVPQLFAILFPGAVGIVLALVGIGIYFLFYLLSKKYRVFLLVSFIVFAIDTFVLLFFMVILFEPAFFIDLAFHGWVWYYLILGTIAWAKLRNVTPEAVQAVMQSAEEEAADAEAKSALETIAPEQNQDNQDDRYEYYGQSDDSENQE